MGSLSVSILHVQCREYAFCVPAGRADDNDFEPQLQARGGDDAAVTYLRPDNMIAKRVWPNGEAMLDFHVTKSGRSVYVSPHSHVSAFPEETGRQARTRLRFLVWFRILICGAGVAW